MKQDSAIHGIIVSDSDFDSILTNPILDIAARFWEEDRYEAFKVCYRSMREIDDYVDNSKSSGSPVSPRQKEDLTNLVKQRLSSLCNSYPVNSYQDELLQTIGKFRIPLWPWQRLAKAMIYDIENDGFRSFTEFLRYTEGAAISPASVFMHLCGVSRVGNEYRPPHFDIRKAARPLALFSYLVHIVRDFEKDQRNNLNYFADDILKKHNVSKEQLLQSVTTEVLHGNIRNLFSEYRHIADFYRKAAAANIKRMLPSLKPQYQLSLQIIYSLYAQIFERIDCENGNFSTQELNPTPAEVQQRIELTINDFQPVN